jgi:hypothetical protein
MATQSGVRKPKLDDSSSDKVIGELLGHGSKSPRGQRLTSDWRGFLREEFELTDAERRDLDAIGSHEREMVQEALSQALEHGGRFRFHPANGGEGGLEVRTKKEHTVGVGGVFHCHFGGGKGWHCLWGDHDDDVENPQPQPPPATNPFDPT